MENNIYNIINKKIKEPVWAQSKNPLVKRGDIINIHSGEAEEENGRILISPACKILDKEKDGDNNEVVIVKIIDDSDGVIARWHHDCYVMEKGEKVQTKDRSFKLSIEKGKLIVEEVVWF